MFDILVLPGSQMKEIISIVFLLLIIQLNKHIGIHVEEKIPWGYQANSINSLGSLLTPTAD